MHASHAIPGALTFANVRRGFSHWRLCLRPGGDEQRSRVSPHPDEVERYRQAVARPACTFAKSIFLEEGMKNCLTYLWSSLCPNGLDNPHSLPHVCEGTGRMSYIPEPARFRVGEWNTVPMVL